MCTFYFILSDYVMKRLSKILVWFIITILSIYVIVCVVFYFFQEKFIFYPDKLDKDYTFHFDQNFEEMQIQMEDGLRLNGLLFKAKSSKGLIFYLHGNAGALNSWGSIAPFYTEMGYDVFFLDYRGFGKSEGHISSQEQLFTDIQTVYNKMEELYDQHKIIVLGYSIGTCPATWLASNNNPGMLILQAPYYSLTDVIINIFPLMPRFLIEYKLETYTYITDCRMPVIIFHGDNDRVINYSNSLRLKELLKPSDILITLNGEGHNNITENAQYQSKLTELLSQ